jgi:hypothetical protein
MSLINLVHLGDLSLTLPAAMAMSTWMLMMRAWRMAFWWSLLFVLGIGLVGATKIAFLGWGSGLPSLGFKALSGHATGATAVFPTLFYLLLRQQSVPLRNTGVAFGLGLGGLVGMLLVITNEHSVAEAIAGCAMGALVSLGCIHLAGEVPLRPPACRYAGSALVFVVSAWIMKSAPVGYWMIKAAFVLSGSDRLHSWDGCG